MSPALQVDDGATLAYDVSGAGRPVLFLHGCWMSSRFFAPALERLPDGLSAVTLDFRGHGASAKVPYGHTLERYAEDVRRLLDELALRDVIVVGWSMGAFVAWELLAAGEPRLAGMVIVDQPASDFRTDDWPLAFADLPALADLMRAVQTDFPAVVRALVPQMFAAPAEPAALAWMEQELLSIPPAIAGAILFDQTVRDYRPLLGRLELPALVCFGRDEKIMPVALGRHLAEQLPAGRLEVFEHSGHCPFFEEPDAFVASLQRFAAECATTVQELSS